MFFSDLSGQGEIQSVILDAFSSQNEEVKAAASYALGKTRVPTHTFVSGIHVAI